METQTSILEHQKKTADQGWSMLILTPIVLLPLLLGSLIFDMGIFWRTVWSLLLLGIGGIVIQYAMTNIRLDGLFTCRLTETHFTQQFPEYFDGPSYHLTLESITVLECHDTGGEGPSHVWYVHTESSRHQITNNYDNPADCFAEEIQQRCPELKLIHTNRD
ncbi:hypothetical protein Rhal01_02078 [Rubritalea halochordaticola]|uniref:Uncharacterized protein n=1 Tax=Rubritalea halochordaticola TaxID=714537 RepID=A0ABP9UZU2_9BACT